MNEKIRGLKIFGNTFIQMYFLVFLLNIGISLIHLRLGGIEVFAGSKPTLAAIFMVFAASSVIIAAFIYENFIKICIVAGKLLLVLLLTHEIYYVIKFKSLSIQVLSLLLIGFGFIVTKKNGIVSQ